MPADERFGCWPGGGMMNYGGWHMSCVRYLACGKANFNRAFPARDFLDTRLGVGDDSGIAGP